MVDKKTVQSQQAKQFSQLLRDYGIIGVMRKPSTEERKKIDQLFPE